MIVIPCKPEHLLAVQGCLAQEGRELIQQHAEDQRDALAEWARTLEHDGRILACFGLSVMWPGVAHAWAMISEDAKRFPLSLTKSVLREIKKIEEQGQIHRIEAAVQAENVRGHRWIEVLGFKMEGFLRNYGLYGKGQYIMYARVH